jgi:hypothetical protein
VRDLGWRVYVRTNPLTMADEAVIISGEEEATCVMSISGDRATMQHVAPGVRVPESAWLQYPQGVLAAIAEAVKPGPSQGEVKRLEEALAVERGRVDELLRKLT